MSFLHAWKAIEQLPFNCSIIVNINPKKIKLSSQKQPIAFIRNSFGSATKRRRQPKKCSKNRSNSKRKSAVSTKNEHFSDSICVCECVNACVLCISFGVRCCCAKHHGYGLFIGRTQQDSSVRSRKINI